MDSKYNDPVKKELTESVIKKWVLAGVLPVKEKYLANTIAEDVSDKIIFILNDT